MSRYGILFGKLAERGRRDVVERRVTRCQGARPARRGAYGDLRSSYRSYPTEGPPGCFFGTSRAKPQKSFVHVLTRFLTGPPAAPPAPEPQRLQALALPLVTRHGRKNSVFCHSDSTFSLGSIC